MSRQRAMGTLPNVKDIIKKNGILTVLLLPKPERISIEELKERYNYEARILSSA